MFKYSPLSQAVLLTLTALATSTAFAQDADETASPSQVLPTIEVAAEEVAFVSQTSTSTLRSTQSNLNTAQTVNVVHQRHLQNYNPTNLDGALTQISGITQGNTLAGTQDTVIKRGFGENRDGSVMVNGMPVVQGRTMNPTVAQVEVLKGPASLLYGIQDPGGIINVVSKKPQYSPQTEISVFGSSYANNRTGYGVTLDHTNAIGSSPFAYRVIASHSQRDYWRNFGELEETLFAPSLAWENDQTKVNLSYQYREYDSPFDRSVVFDLATNRALIIPKERRLDEAFNQMKGKNHLAQLSIDHKINDQWQAHFGYGYNRETYQANQLRVLRLNTTNNTVTRRNDGTGDAESIDSSAQFYVNGQFNTGRFQHHLQLGSDMEYRKYYRGDMIRGATNTLNYLNPVYGSITPATNVVASDSDQTDKLHTYGFYLQDSIDLSPRWTGVFGVRYTHWDQVAGRGRPFVTNTDTRNGKWLPRAGVIFKINPQNSLYFSYSESLKPTAQIAPLTTNANIAHRTIGNIEPEQSQSYELGWKYEVADRTLLNLAVFDITKQNMMLTQENTTTNTVELYPSGEVRSRGVEFDLTHRFNEQWDANFTYANTQVRVTKDDIVPNRVGLQLVNVPRYTSSVAVNYQPHEFLGGKWRFGANANYIAKRAGNEANTFQLPSYILANAYASYETKIADKSVNFRLNVNNLFDKTYYPSSVNNINVSPGEAREFVLRTTLKF